jgi:hypothetical protein
VKKELEDKNCIIIASADVNPLTEILLFMLYTQSTEIFTIIKKHSFSNNREFIKNFEIKFNNYIIMIKDQIKKSNGCAEETNEFLKSDEKARFFAQAIQNFDKPVQMKSSTVQVLPVYEELPKSRDDENVEKIKKNQRKQLQSQNSPDIKEIQMFILILKKKKMVSKKICDG